MADLLVTKKNFEFQYRGPAALTLDAANAPFINKLLKVYRRSTSTALAIQSFAGSAAGTVPGGAVTQLIPGLCYRAVAAVFDGSWSIPNAVDVDDITYGVAPANMIPTASTNTPAAITLPTNSVALMGTGTDSDGTITGYAWRQVTGPNTATGLPATTQNVVASNLVAGTYQFGFKTQDNAGAWSNEVFTNATVNAAAATHLPDYIVAIGDSNQFGHQLVSPATESSFAQLGVKLANNPNYIMGANYAQSGRTTEEQIGLGVATIVSGYDATKHRRLIVLSDFGINDIGKNGKTPAQLATLYTQLIALFPAYADVYVQTIWATNWSVSQPPVQSNVQTQSKVNGTNALARTDAVTIWKAAGIIDDAKDARSQDPTNQTFVQKDQLHKTKLGHGVTADNTYNFLVNGTQVVGTALTDATPPPNGLLYNEHFTVAATGDKDTGWLLYKNGAAPLATIPGNGTLHFNGQDGDVAWQNLHGLVVGQAYQLGFTTTALSGGTLALKSEFTASLINATITAAGTVTVSFTAATASESIQIISTGPTVATLTGVVATVILAPTAPPLLNNPNFTALATQDKSTGWLLARFAQPAGIAATIPADGLLHFNNQTDDLCWQTLHNPTVGVTYQLKIVVASLSAGGSFHIVSEWGSGLPQPTISAVGTFTYNFTLSQTTEGIQVISGPGTATISEVSITKV